jgi:tRNA threonylcarbamoyl adenosine modification protein YeaZ
MILAIDSCAGQCAVALLADGRIVARRAEAMQRGHADHLFALIDFALAEAGAGYLDLSRIAVCTGPGSFTGIRIGVAAARGLSLGRHIPALGVTRFEALAEGRTGAGRPVAVALAARGPVFLQLFGADGAAGKPRHLPPEALAEEVPEDALRLGDAWPGASAEDGLPDPAAIARIAAAREPGPPPSPHYLREADAAPPRRAPPARIG